MIVTAKIKILSDNYNTYPEDVLQFEINEDEVVLKISGDKRKIGINRCELIDLLEIL